MGSGKYRVWSQDELAALRKGVRRHGAGNWEQIKQDPELAPDLATRSGEQIKDKWRNLVKFNHVSKQEVEACSRIPRLRGLKRNVTFDSASRWPSQYEPQRSPVRRQNSTLSLQLESGAYGTEDKLDASSKDSSDLDMPCYHFNSSDQTNGQRRRVRPSRTVPDLRDRVNHGPTSVPMRPLHDIALEPGARLELRSPGGHQDACNFKLDFSGPSLAEQRLMRQGSVPDTGSLQLQPSGLSRPWYLDEKSGQGSSSCTTIFNVVGSNPSRIGNANDNWFDSNSIVSDRQLLALSGQQPTSNWGMLHLDTSGMNLSDSAHAMAPVAGSFFGDSGGMVDELSFLGTGADAHPQRSSGRLGNSLSTGFGMNTDRPYSGFPGVQCIDAKLESQGLQNDLFHGNTALESYNGCPSTGTYSWY